MNISNKDETRRVLFHATLSAAHHFPAVYYARQLPIFPLSLSLLESIAKGYKDYSAFYTRDDDDDP